MSCHSSLLAIIAFIFLFMLQPTYATDLPFVFDENTPLLEGLSSQELQRLATSGLDDDIPPISEVSEDEVMEFTEVGGKNVASGGTKSTAGELKEIFNSRVEPDNELVHDTAVITVFDHPGDYSLYPVCAIFDYLTAGDESTEGWRYYPDPHGTDLYYYANKTLINGQKMEVSGFGDCDDFAILMASLVESIGGTTRIILAYNQSVGHAYTEVYVGSVNDAENQVRNVIEALKEHYGVSEVFTHIDTDNGDVWLNLDRWPDGNMLHPGGPFFSGNKHIPLRIRDQYGKTSMQPPEGFWVNQPPTLKGLIPNKTSPQNLDKTIRWTVDASDPDGDTIYYKFWLEDPSSNGAFQPVQDWSTKDWWDWTPSLEGDYEINVSIRDGKHAGTDSWDEYRVVSFIVTSSSYYQDNIITNIEFNAPNYIMFGNDVDVTFDYETTAVGGVRIWVEPWTERSHSNYSSFSGSPIYPFGSGSVLANFTIDPRLSPYYLPVNSTDVVEVDKVRIHMYSAVDPYELLFETFIPVDFDFENPYLFYQRVNEANEWSNKGFSLRDSGKLEEAIECFDNAIEADPNHIPFSIIVEKGRALCGLGRYEEAIECCDYAIKMTSEDTLEYDSALGIKERAIEALNQNSNLPPTAISLDPNKTSPQTAGASVTFNAIATYPDGDSLLYRFWLKGPSTGNKWVVKQDWDSSNV